jgi:hypothetical protein
METGEIVNEQFFMWNDDGGASASPPDSPPPKPQPPSVTCYCCGNKPSKMDTWDFYDRYVFVGTCCGKDFRKEVYHSDIKNKGVTTYVVNLS